MNLNKLVILAAVALLQLTGASARIGSSKIDPEVKCPTLCERDYQPVCGSDRVLYANLCLFKVAHCLNLKLKRENRSRCKNPKRFVSRVSQLT
ncbi:hypothetical protein PR003_g6370 [Phytophthora rubi]|uniref:Kazal-like domain-containing protein n=1 Tax=Phytophthora rubi TaxID=129364 RepID=A0A6A3N268_9STRA|nr:hypothetical protein PR002_g6391 [Phytophthora rubi]KAE9042390.1 hypothetical protein PR001_g6207 [Phytophthora rubi]KAE9348538.1 hypothetical protein PR003_g6370 [Phytophthora rubi]